MVRLIFITICIILSSCKQDLESSSKINQEKSSELVIYNWEDYTPMNVIEQFENETGIKVTIKTFQTIEEQISKLQSNPNLCDLVIVDAHESQKVFLPLKLIEELDVNLFENTQSYHHRYTDFQKFGVPYCFGILGLAVDKRYVNQNFKNYSILLKPEYKNKLSLLKEPADLYNICLNASGFSVNDNSQKAHMGAIDFASKLKKQNPIYQDVYGGLDDLAAGKVIVAMAYSGDTLLYKEKNQNIEFIYPTERPLIFEDLVCVSANAPNRENAYRFLKYINRPQVAAEIAVQFKYAPGIVNAEKFMDQKSLNNKLINISQDFLRACECKTGKGMSHIKMNRVYQVLAGGQDR